MDNQPMTIELFEDGQDQYCPYLIIQPIRVFIKWTAGYRTREEDSAARAEALAKAQRIIDAIEQRDELLAALKEIIRDVADEAPIMDGSYSPTPTDAIRAARAAIAKAEA